MCGRPFAEEGARDYADTEKVREVAPFQVPSGPGGLLAVRVGLRFATHVFHQLWRAF